MPTVYRVLPDPDPYQFALADNPKALNQYAFNGFPIRDTWKAPTAYSPRPNLKVGDFWSCFSRNSIFAVTVAAAPKIVTYLDQSCETLPLSVDAHQLLVCNVTYVLNCLDEKNSHHKPGLPEWIDKYIFHPNRFEYSLFKIPQTCMKEILCVEGVVSAQDEFKGTVEGLGLTGLRFQKIWSDELDVE